MRRGANPLVVGELRVGHPHDVGRVCPRLEHQRNLHTLFAVLRHADGRGLFDAWHGVDDALDVLGKDVEPFRRDDHFLLAAADEQPSLRVELTDIAGMKPAFLKRRVCRFRSAVISSRHVLAAHENFAVRRDLDIDAGDRLCRPTLGWSRTDDSA